MDRNVEKVQTFCHRCNVIRGIVVETIEQNANLEFVENSVDDDLTQVDTQISEDNWDKTLEIDFWINRVSYLFISRTTKTSKTLVIVLKMNTIEK